MSKFGSDAKCRILKTVTNLVSLQVNTHDILEILQIWYVCMSTHTHRHIMRLNPCGLRAPSRRYG